MNALNHIGILVMVTGTFLNEGLLEALCIGSIWALWGSPYNKDHGTLRSILGPLILVSSHSCSQQVVVAASEFEVMPSRDVE